MESGDINMITNAQLRAARALVGWSAQELADRTRLGVATIRRAEQCQGPVKMTSANAALIVETFKNAGVSFFVREGGGVGVVLETAIAAS